ncbi:MAG: FxsA family protein [Nostocoides sp.]
MSPATRRPAPPRRRWPWLLVLVLLLGPILEIAVIVAVGRVIGGWPAIVLLLAESAFGAWLVRREGERAWAALRSALTTGRMPSRELADAALILVGGALLLTPGFVTDIVGFLVVLPLTRAVSRAVLERAVAARLFVKMPGVDSVPGEVVPEAPRDASSGTGKEDVIEGEIIDEQPPPQPPAGEGRAA